MKYSSTLLASLVLLAACGGKKDDSDEGESKGSASVSEAPSTDAQDVVVPDAPTDPRAAINAERSAALFASVRAKDNVRELDNGIVMHTLVAGTPDGDVAGPQDMIRVHMRIFDLDGNILEDTRAFTEEPAVLQSYEPLYVPGLPVAMAAMTEGTTARFVVPAEMAFGEEGLGPFEPNQALYYEVELAEVITADEGERRAELEAEQARKEEERREAARQAHEAARAAREKLAADNLARSETYLAENAQRDGVIVTDSGLQYEVIKDGGDGQRPDPWDVVEVHYSGTLIDGTPFDSSYDRGKPYITPLNQVIDGWTEGVGLMNVGDTYRFHIPSELGYGENPRPGGVIGPNDALVFDVELMRIEDVPAPEGAPQ